ncbi:TonB-dependent receptor [Sinomicrobium kalidii]|uniref:TonB-dependent receptor n=1 Tax=Sinomicrobium kalidii TaxID=2900738 RepID=UPI001E29FF50|nr:carboxypeptidase-like regulatory domain-containing protein [Sinomicrobium kalidii]UGU17742.1 TonB-dependent receptor [Sinomicrobium kalidii]
MKTIYNGFLTVVFALIATATFAQGTVTGTVIDAEMNEPLPGANVVVKGTSTGVSTDFDGNFQIEVPENSGTLVVSYIGFVKKEIRFSSPGDIGNITLQADTDELEGVVVVGSGVIDLEQDRKTPVAVSTITRAEIQTKGVGNVEFPELMKNTPNVYVSNQSGGFGDSQMFVRGFDQRNTAFLLNGQPINGMEDGRMYWSNWAGISDIANAVQTQRGLGSSKLAISSVGGTINIVTKATESNQGGFARFMTGNDSYIKGTVGYNTGIGENGWGFSFMLDHWQAHRKYAAGTKGQGQNYFFSVGKRAGDHNFNFLITGAPQWHDQNFSKDRELYDQYGIKYNNNYGFKNGEYLSLRRNYYHKPVMNLNWDWNISEKSNLSTVVYASFGRGGGTGDYGSGPGYVENGIDSSPEGAYTENGLIDWDYIVNEYNPGIEGGFSEGYNGTLLRASVNNHAWYGTVVNYEFNNLKNLTVNGGIDVRFYKGDHFRQLIDLLGLQGRREEFGGNPNHEVTTTFKANPWSALFNFADEDERVNYDYSENINYQGAFGQIEWSNDVFSAFVQGALSNQDYKREDRGNFAETKESKTVNKLGYNIKAGASWTFAEGNTIFVNSGKYSRQPFLDNIFPSYDDNTQLADPEVDNEEIVGFEAGYRLEIPEQAFQLNFNAYYTTWENRFLDRAGEFTQSGVTYDDVTFMFTDIAQVHKGLELDVKWKPMLYWTLRGYATVGDWEYDGSTPIRIRNNNDNEFIDEISGDLTGTKVGEAPQASAGLGTSYDILPNKLNFYIDWNYYANLYGFVKVDEFADAIIADEPYETEKLKPYSLFDVGASYNFNLGDNKFIVRGNIFNALDHEYISQKDNYGYFYGNGLTWNLSVQYQF